MAESDAESEVSESSRTRVVLTFGDAGVQAWGDEGLEALHQQVLKRFALPADSFQLFDDCGRVDSERGLQRAVAMAGEGVCVLEVRERPEWRRLRELDGRLRTLAARVPSCDDLRALEDRMLQRLECVQKQRQDERETVIGEADNPGKLLPHSWSAANALDSCSRAAIEELQETIQSIRLHVESSIAELASSKASRLSAELDDLRAVVLQEVASMSKAQEGVDFCLQSLHEKSQLTQEAVKSLRTEVRSLDQKCNDVVGNAAQPMSFAYGDNHFPAAFTSTTPSPSKHHHRILPEISYSKKKTHVESKGISSPSTTNLAGVSRRLEGALLGCRSMPQLRVIDSF